MFASDGVVFLQLNFSLDGLLVLGRIISVALADTFCVPDGDKLYKMDL